MTRALVDSDVSRNAVSRSCWYFCSPRMTPTLSSSFRTLSSSAVRCSSFAIVSSELQPWPSPSVCHGSSAPPWQLPPAYLSAGRPPPPPLTLPSHAPAAAPTAAAPSGYVRAARRSREPPAASGGEYERVAPRYGGLVQPAAALGGHYLGSLDTDCGALDGAVVLRADSLP